MNRHAALLVPLLVAACGSDHGLSKSTALLNDRLRVTMAADIAGGRAALQPLQDGARVTLLQPGLYPADKPALADNEIDVRAGVIEGMLEPSLIEIAVTDTSSLPPVQQEQRVRNVQRYFAAYGLGQTLQDAPLPEATPNPPGLAIRIKLLCPGRRQPDNWGMAPTTPSCY